MKHYGKKESIYDVATMTDIKEPGDVYVTTFGVPTYLSWSSGSSVLNICGCDALTEDCEIRLFRYKRRRNGSDQGRTRHHGWRDCTEEFDEERRFRIVGTGNVREIARLVLQPSGKLHRVSPSEYQTTRGNGFSLSYRCAFAIFKDGQRVSDMMHFSVDKFGVYGSW